MKTKTHKDTVSQLSEALMESKKKGTLSNINGTMVKQPPDAQLMHFDPRVGKSGVRG